MAPTSPEVLSNRPEPLWPATRRTGGEATWLWVTYLLGALAIVVVTVLMADDLARGAGAPTSGQWFYVTLAVATAAASPRDVRLTCATCQAERADIRAERLTGAHDQRVAWGEDRSAAAA